MDVCVLQSEKPKKMFLSRDQKSVENLIQFIVANQVNKKPRYGDDVH